MFLRKLWSDHRGMEAIEYVIVGALMVMILALAFLALFNAIQAKLNDVADSL